MTLSILLDFVVAGLLVATIAYAALLSRRLGALRNDKQQLEMLVRSLDESSRQAQSGIAALKEAAEQIGQQLQRKIEHGTTLRTDLTYIVALDAGPAHRLHRPIPTHPHTPR